MSSFGGKELTVNPQLQPSLLLMSPHHTLVVWFASIQWVCTPDTLIQSNPGQQRLSRMLESFEGDHLKFW